MAYDPDERQRCEVMLGHDHQCEKSAGYLVMTQIPPYTQMHTCDQHLAITIDRMLGHHPMPVIVRRYHAWTIEL